MVNTTNKLLTSSHALPCLNKLTVKGFAVPLSSLLEIILAFFLVSLKRSSGGGFINITNGLNSYVRKCFTVWEEEKFKLISLFLKMEFTVAKENLH